jgi:hypothetical protein
MEQRMKGSPSDEWLKRHDRFLTCMPTERPLVGFWTGGYYPSEQFTKGTARWHEGCELVPSDVRFSSFATDYERLYQLHQELEDDGCFVASPYWGIPWLEAIMGCRVFSGRETAWAHSFLDIAETAVPHSFDLDSNPWWQSLLDFMHELIAYSANRFPVCAPLLRGPGDTLSAMLGPMSYALAFFDTPAQVRFWLEYVSKVRLEIIHRLGRLIPAWHGMFAAGGYPSRLLASRPIAYHQEDSSALLNPRLFTEFLLPCQRQQCMATPLNFIHLHSANLYPVDVLINEPLFNVLEINIDHSGVAPPLPAFIPLLKKIQMARKPLLLWGRISQSDVLLLQSELSPIGLSLQPMVESTEEAQSFWKTLCTGG